MSILDQLRQWRGRWRPAESSDHLDQCFTVVFGTPEGVETLDYLIATYYASVLDGGLEGPSYAKLAEDNGKRQMMTDILQRIEAGRQPKRIEQEAEVIFDARRH